MSKFQSFGEIPLSLSISKRQYYFGNLCYIACCARRLSRRQADILKNRPHLNSRPLPPLAQLEHVYLLEMQDMVAAVFRAKCGLTRTDRLKTVNEPLRVDVARERA